LQAHQLAAEKFGNRLCGLGLADAGGSFEQQRLAEPECQEDRRRQAFVRR